MRGGVCTESYVGQRELFWLVFSWLMSDYEVKLMIGLVDLHDLLQRGRVLGIDRRRETRG